MNTLLNPSYLFDVLPGNSNPLFWQAVMIIAGAALLFGIVAIFIARRYTNDGLRRHLWHRYAAWGLTFGTVALVLAFFRFQNAYFLSMRVFIFGWLLFAAAWLLRIVYFTVMVLPKKLRARDEKAFFEKYLPHKK